MKKFGAASYVIAGVGFIPLVGIPFALVSLIRGVINCRNGGIKLAVLGVLGLMLTVSLYGTLFYEGFVKRGGMFDDLRTKQAQMLLNDLVPKIEYYKLQKGYYPDTLNDLQKFFGKESVTFIYDPTALLSVGGDQKPFTHDDIIPTLNESERSKTGLLVNPQSLPIPSGQ